jgi:RNA polymerase sigma-70 factor (sigma-E family)
MLFRFSPGIGNRCGLPIVSQGVEVAGELGVTAGRSDMEEDFVALYLRDYEAMVRLAVLLVDSRQVAEEVVQDAFAAVLIRYASLSNPDGYLRRCVINGAREVQRRRRVARLHLPEPVADATLPVDHVLDAVARLPYRQRAAIVLRYYSDLSEAEIASTMGIPPGSVKSALHRGLRRLRTELT